MCGVPGSGRRGSGRALPFSWAGFGFGLGSWLWVQLRQLAWDRGCACLVQPDGVKNVGVCAMGQGLGRLARSCRVQLSPIPPADGKQFAAAEQ